MENSGTVRGQMFSLVAQWESSGLSQKAFCTQHQIVYHRFHYWYKRYRTSQDSSWRQQSATFVPLTIGADPAYTEVVLPSGVRIIFHQPVTAPFLIQLIR